MSIQSVRKLSIIGMIAGLQCIPLFVSSVTLLFWLPVVAVCVIAWLYRNEIRAYSFRSWQTVSFWSSVFLALTQGIIGQAIGIAVVAYGFGIAQSSAAFAVTPAVIINAVLFSTILEETVYRGIIFKTLDRYIGFWPASVLSSLVFATAHFRDYSAFLGYAILGIVWCRAYKKSGDLSVPIVAHMLFNAVYFIVASLRG